MTGSSFLGKGLKRVRKCERKAFGTLPHDLTSGS